MLRHPVCLTAVAYTAKQDFPCVPNPMSEMPGCPPDSVLSESAFVIIASQRSHSLSAAGELF